MITKQGVGCKKRIVQWDYDLLPVRLRLAHGITKTGVRKHTRK